MADGCTLGNFLVQNRLNISYVAKLRPTYGAMPCGSDQTINGVMLSDLHLPRYIADGSTYEDRRDNSLVGGQRTLCPHNIDEGLPDACRVTEESAREIECVCVSMDHRPQGSRDSPLYCLSAAAPELSRVRMRSSGYVATTDVMPAPAPALKNRSGPESFFTFNHCNQEARMGDDTRKGESSWTRPRVR
jgi:hypothetical protein